MLHNRSKQAIVYEESWKFTIESGRSLPSNVIVAVWQDEKLIKQITGRNNRLFLLNH
jgi:hypothetical protein